MQGNRFLNVNKAALWIWQRFLFVLQILETISIALGNVGIFVREQPHLARVTPALLANSEANYHRPLYYGLDSLDKPTGWINRERFSFKTQLHCPKPWRPERFRVRAKRNRWVASEGSETLVQDETFWENCNPIRNHANRSASLCIYQSSRRINFNLARHNWKIGWSLHKYLLLGQVAFFTMFSALLTLSPTLKWFGKVTSKTCRARKFYGPTTAESKWMVQTEREKLPWHKCMRTEIEISLCPRRLFGHFCNKFSAQQVVLYYLGETLLPLQWPPGKLDELHVNRE